MVDTNQKGEQWHQQQLIAKSMSDFREEILMVMEIHGRGVEDLRALVRRMDWRATDEAEQFYKTPREEWDVAPCLDCNVSTIEIGEYYAVQNDIWEESKVEDDRGDQPHIYLCIGCLEERIGRKLNPEDFSYCLINWDRLYYRSSRFCDRLGLPTYAE